MSLDHLDETSALLKQTINSSDKELRSNASGYVGTGAEIKDNTESKKALLLFFWAVALTLLGAFQFGFHSGVINIPEVVIRDCKLGDATGPSGLPYCFDGTDDITWALVVAMFPAGGMIGGMFGGRVADRYGPRSVLSLNNLVVFVGSALMAAAPHVAVLIVGRFVIGLACGVFTATVPMYLGELAPLSIKGRIGSLNQTTICIGVLFACGIGIPLSTVEGWRWLLSLGAFTGLLQLVLLWTCPERQAMLGSMLVVMLCNDVWLGSPDWLGRHNQVDKAKAAMLNLYGVVEDAKLAAALAQADLPRQSLRSLYDDRVLRRLLGVAVTLQLAQQFSGINAVINYSTGFFIPLFPDNPEAAQYVTVGMNAGMLLAAFAAIVVIDRGGRRPLLLVGQALMAAALATLVATSVLDVAVAAAVCTVLFVTAFGMSVGPVPWLIFAELFQPAAVGAASSVCVPANWLSNIIVSVTFPALDNAMDRYVFLPFAIFNVLFLLFTWFVVPETKGKSASQLYDEALAQQKGR